jgi:pantetheine-phosphate adenylyltransferase
MSRIAVCPGSFDPPTMGHLDIIQRASAQYDRLVVGVGTNPAKGTLFSVEERVEMLRECCAPLANVSVQSFDGLLIQFAVDQGACAIVKGLRAVSDFEYELAMAAANRVLESGIETVFLMTNQEYSYLSSSIVKEIGAMGGNVSSWVPASVEKRLRARLGFS